MKRSIFLLSGIFLLFIFAVFSREIKHGVLKDFDFAIAVKVQDNIPQRSLPFWKSIALFANPYAASIIVGLITIFSFFDIKNKKIRFSRIVIPLAFLLVIGAEIYGKTIVPHSSPHFFFIKNPTAEFPQYYINNEYSYPSGHAARAAFIAGIIILLTLKWPLKKRLFTIFIVLGYLGIISLSQLYLGHHWFSDVLGGILIASGLTSLSGILIIDSSR